MDDRRCGEGASTEASTPGWNGSLPLCDSHIHLDDLGLAPADLPEGWSGLIPGVTPAGVESVLTVWHAAGAVRVAAALHPRRVCGSDPSVEADPRWAHLEALVCSGRVDAVGETGLDALHFRGDAEGAGRALDWFVAHLALAREFDLPVVVHAVRCPGLLLETLDRAGRGTRGVVHAFTGAPEVAEALWARGYRLGIGGRVTDAGAKRLRRAVCALPMEALLVETDAPWIGVDGRREGRLEDLWRVVEEVALLRSMTPREVVCATAEAFDGLFPLRRSRVS